MATCEFSRPPRSESIRQALDHVHRPYQRGVEPWTLDKVPSWVILAFLVLVLVIGYGIGLLFRAV